MLLAMALFPPAWSWCLWVVSTLLIATPCALAAFNTFDTPHTGQTRAPNFVDDSTAAAGMCMGE